MPSEEVTKAAVKDLIIGFGVAEGLWIYAGVNPIEEILNAFIPLLQGTQFEWYGPFSWVMLFIVVPIIQILLTYNWGGMLGILALLMAFISGIFIGNIVGILLAFAAVGLGYYSFLSDKKISFSDFISAISDIIDYFRR